jgi:hypothetical protein
VTSLAFPQFPQLDEIYTLGDRAWKWNGYAWDRISASSGELGPQPYVIGHFAGGLLEQSEKLFMHPATVLVQFPANMAGSKVHAGTAPQNDAELLLTIGATTVGAVQILANAHEGTFLTSSAFSFDPAEDHILSLIAPSVADPSLADLGVSLKGTRV